jgi:hypothetical protein
MSRIFLLTILVVSGCTPAAPEFSKPAENAPMWDLNPGEWPGANAMIQPPIKPLSETPSAR